MRPYTVDWDPDAEDELARIWLQTADPAVTQAQARIDRLLATDPVRYGWHVAEGLHRIDVPPLIANFTLDLGGRRVQVTWVSYNP